MGNVGKQGGYFLSHSLLHIRRLSLWLVIAILASAVVGCGAPSSPGLTEIPGATIIPTQTDEPDSMPASTPWKPASVTLINGPTVTDICLDVADCQWYNRYS